MKNCAIALGFLCLFATANARADSAIEAVQRALKDQGFYYGEVTGQKDADTTAAIRRYQIRNGLKITGEINAETQKSLGMKVTVAPPQPPAPTSARPKFPPAPREETVAPPETVAPTETPDLRAVFIGGPYENTSPETQRRVLMSAQAVLARRGYYRDLIDGVYGPNMQFALHAYQTRFGMEANGRLDAETLAVMGLLPNQVAPGVTAPRGRFYQRRPSSYTPRGEPIYEGR